MSDISTAGSSGRGYMPDSIEQPKAYTRPTVAVPPGSCDTHCHVFGPYEQFPLHQPSSYAAPDAPAQRYLQVLDDMGMERGVLVQPAPYGTDVSAIIDAVARRPQSLRGIGVVGETAELPELQKLASAGISGLRFVEARDPSGQLFPGSVGFATVDTLAPLMRQAGLHVQLWGPYDSYAQHLERLADLGLPVVIDHMASLVIGRGQHDPIFQTVVRLLSQGKLWVKLSVCRVSRQSPGYEDARPFHDALLSANPDQVLWGSDWPYVRMGEAAPDIGQLVDLAYDWLGDDATRRKVWVDNPQALYGFA